VVTLEDSDEDASPAAVKPKSNATGTSCYADGECEACAGSGDSFYSESINEAMHLNVHRAIHARGQPRSYVISIEEEADGTKIFLIGYNDDDEEELDEAEVISLLKAYCDRVYSDALECINPAFNYLEKRLSGDCQPQYSFKHSHEIFRLVRVFDPSFLSENEGSIDDAFIDSLIAIKPLSCRDGALIEALKKDLHLYVAAARGFVVDHSDVDLFTDEILRWWKNRGRSTGAWRDAAELAFSLTPNSASAERFFRL